MTVATRLKRALPLALLTTLGIALPITVAVGALDAADAFAAPATVKAQPALRGPLPYEVSLVSCTRSPRAETRVATVAASMRPVAGATRLALRVDLYQRPLSGGRWALRADVPGLGTWNAPSDPSVGSRPNDVYTFRMAVGQLSVPSAYRFRASFRWSDAAGAIVREELATSAICKQADLRPDLTLTRIVVEPDRRDADSARYRVVVRNLGRTTASNVVVAASSFSAPQRTVKRLAPGESVEVSFQGPSCQAAGSPPAFGADPANAIDEARESNNSLVASCPATLDEP